MKIHENCKVIASENGLGENFVNYFRQLIKIAHETPVYIAIEPATITILIENVKYSLAIAPGSAIICDNVVETSFQYVYKVAEITWIDTKILVPYAKNFVCSHRVKQLDLEIDLNEELGIPHICIDDEFSSESFIELIRGGVAEFKRYNNVYEGRIEISVKSTPFFYFVKGFGIKLRYENVNAKYFAFNIDSKYVAYLDDLIKLGNNDVILHSFGEGYIVSFYEISNVENMLYALALFSAYLRNIDDPRARAYRSRFI
ncbi:hypothetical protein QPL79_03045 [Ignisphaera sp. 4213-co]|uniref:DUF432 domain-containing protein n=1 Tax=Ignisphaera cupida TaxID=3050454 RepID=A0ABD4Z6H4_9CREN|nr:hypothetical protein [Ignisphaera sp. 4213-co]MDK6028339.1 hypothetical protein [Ignisphaera sp. 4213-co]